MTDTENKAPAAAAARKKTPEYKLNEAAGDVEASRDNCHDVLHVGDLVARAIIDRGWELREEDPSFFEGVPEPEAAKRLRFLINRLLYDSYDALLSGACMLHTIEGDLAPGLDTVIPELRDAGFRAAAVYVPECDHAQLEISIRRDVLQCGYFMNQIHKYQKDPPRPRLLSRYRRRSLPY